MSKFKIFNSLKHLGNLFSMREDINDSFFDEKSIRNERIGCIPSRTGNYALEVKKYYFANPDRAWTRGVIYRNGDPFLHVNRMASDFPFSWVEKHLDHRDNHYHDYLLCASTPGGYTNVQLDTGEIRDFVPDDVKRGKEHGFRILEFFPSPDKLSLLLRGDHFEENKKDLVLLDFSDPMNLPYREIRRYPDFESYSVWRPGGFFDVSLQREVRVRDGRPYDWLDSHDKHLIDEGLERSEQRYETILCSQDGKEKKIRSIKVPEGKKITWRDFVKYK